MAQPSDSIPSAKAKQILEDKEVQGHPLTEAQRKMFGAAAGRERNAEGEKPFKWVNPGLEALHKEGGPKSLSGAVAEQRQRIADEETSHYGLGRITIQGAADKMKASGHTLLGGAPYDLQNKTANYRVRTPSGTVSNMTSGQIKSIIGGQKKRMADEEMIQYAQVSTGPYINTSGQTRIASREVHPIKEAIHNVVDRGVLGKAQNLVGAGVSAVKKAFNAENEGVPEAASPPALHDRMSACYKGRMAATEAEKAHDEFAGKEPSLSGCAAEQLERLGVEKAKYGGGGFAVMSRARSSGRPAYGASTPQTTEQAHTAQVANRPQRSLVNKALVAGHMPGIAARVAPRRWGGGLDTTHSNRGAYPATTG